jgi:hypothetical protein
MGKRHGIVWDGSAAEPGMPGKPPKIRFCAAGWCAACCRITAPNSGVMSLELGGIIFG